MANGTEEIEATGPGGIKFRAAGANIILLLIALATVFTLYLIWEHKREARDEIKSYTEEHRASMKLVAEALSQNAEAQSEMNYILTLKPEAREQLRLDMPDSLRKRVR